MPRTKNPKSPLRLLTRNDLRSLRALAREAAAWKREVATGDYRWIRNVDTVVREGGGRPGLWQWRTMDELEYRALNRLMMRDNWQDIHEARNRAYLRRYDPAAFETLMLREEVAELRERVPA